MFRCMMRRPSTPRPAFVHIGASKTGTSALQRGLWDSVDQLAEAGVGVPLPGRPAHVRRLLRPLGWVTGSGFVKPINHSAVGRLARKLRSTAGDRLLLSNEDLCEAGPAQIEVIADLADKAGLEISVVLTLRNLASVLPSEWQQFLKHRLTTDYPTFLAEVRDHEGPAAAHFWQRQDAVAIGERWSAVTGPDRFHVIVVPPMQQDPGGVFRLFGEVVGFPPDALQLPETDVNASLGYVEAEVYRRLNAALGRRLPDLERDYQPAVRRILLHGVLARGASDRITLPPEHVAWVREEAQRQRQGILDAGYVVHGAIDRLVPSEDVGRPLPELDEADVARAAVATLANFAVQQHRAARK
jgi:hypothetical protein